MSIICYLKEYNNSNYNIKRLRMAYMDIFAMNKIKRDEYKTVMYYIAVVIIILGTFMIIPMLTAIIYHDSSKYLLSFIASSIICIIMGTLIFLNSERKDITNLSLKGSMFFVMMIWLVTAFFSALPFIISGDLSFIDAYFEAMSGITSTGFTMYEIKLLPYSIAIWRSLLQWFGGLGIIFLLLVIVPSVVSLKRLYFAEGKTEQMMPNIRHTSINFIKVYLVLTTIAITAYVLAGLSVFDAVCYSFTALGTGGFSVNPTNLNNFVNPLIQSITIVLMIMGGTNFLIHYKIMKRDWTNITKDYELRLMFIILIFATSLIAINLYTSGFYGHDVVTILRHSLFQVTSVLTSTGFSSTDINLWTPFSIQVLIVLMFIGGCVCSTAGGIKIYNIAIVLKSLWWSIQQMFIPQKVIFRKKIFHNKLNREITIDTIRTVQVYVFFYILLFLISLVIVLFYCNDFETAYCVVAASIGNTGLSLSYVSQSIPMVVKIVLIIDFWAGRIGIWPILLPIAFMVNKFTK